MPLCDTLLRLAAAGLYRPCWTDEILDEAIRNLIADGRVPAASRRRELMVRAFPEAMVHGYQPLIAGMSNHPKDRHVAAAAVRAAARGIVTANLRDFEPAPDGIAIWSPDQFLTSLAEDHGGVVLDVLSRQSEAMRRPPTTLTSLLNRLQRTAPTFVAMVRSRCADD